MWNISFLTAVLLPLCVGGLFSESCNVLGKYLALLTNPFLLKKNKKLGFAFLCGHTGSLMWQPTATLHCRAWASLCSGFSRGAWAVGMHGLQ